MSATFEFRQSISLLRSTGRKARTLRELRDGIAATSDDCIYHHTYQYFEKGMFREYTNDFAHWAGESLEEQALAEQLSNIDPYEHSAADELRARLLAVVDDYLREFPEPREARPRDEFYFNEATTFVFPVGILARNLAEFLVGIKYIDDACLYYHFYEARTRLGGEDDFSRWIDQELGKGELAERIRSVDPFMHSVDGIRQIIVDAVEREVQRDMQGAGVQP